MMVSEEIYDLCLPILNDEKLEEEERVEKLEEFLRDNQSLTGSSLENTLLDVLWRHRHSTKQNASSPPVRHTVIRRSSPAPWQMQVPRSSTPLSSPSNTGTSPAAPSGFPISRSGFPRSQRSLNPSPFTSPRPSPRLAMAHPIPHSPNLNAYEFSDAQLTTPEVYGDLGSDNVDWLVNDDSRSTASSTVGVTISGISQEWFPAPDMSPYDILRSVLGDRRTNDEIEAALEANAYDLGATIVALTDQDAAGSDASGAAAATMTAATTATTSDGRVLIGKSMTMDQSRPITPSGPFNTRSPVVCKYWLSTGQCLRADCRFSHDLDTHVCKYWLAGGCLAANNCPFSHDPSALIGSLAIAHNDNNNASAVTGNTMQMHLEPAQQPYQDNYESFPTLPTVATPDQWPVFYPRKQRPPQFIPPGSSSPRMKNNRGSALNPSSRPHSRPTSRHQHRDSPAPAVDDPDAFPTLSSVGARAAGKKHHGKRGGHSNNQKENNAPGSLADVVKMSPPGPGQRKNNAAKSSRPSTASRENSAAAQAIPAPKHIPWLETGPRANQQYLKYRQDAITHGNVRNKFLQSASQAWNRNDARAAKALSLRGQAENEAMRRCHREAARHLYEERNKHLSNVPNDGNNLDEIYIDLHGLHPNEAIDYLENVLVEQAKCGRRVLYAITGTGHHSKNGKDKVGKAVKNWLNEWRYTFREFSTPGDRNGFVGGVLGIDPTTYDRGLAAAATSAADTPDGDDDKGATMTIGKIQVLKREDITAKLEDAKSE